MTKPAPAKGLAMRRPSQRSKPPTAIWRQHGDSHERQADMAANAFVRGGRGLADGLTPTPTAGFRPMGSIGETLPQPLRMDLELAFNTGLGSVRIHRDALAQLAARRLQALAFASGAHVYFASGTYDPHSESGRMLIGHELAHVIQQAGRVGTGGRRQVQDVAGAAAVQRVPKPDQLPDEATMKATFADFIAMHRGGSASTGDVEFEKTIEDVRSLLGDQMALKSKKASFSKPLQEAAAAGKFDKLKSPRARSFVVDALKINGWYEQAAALLADDGTFRLRTFITLDDFSEFLWTTPPYGPPWLEKWLTTEPFSRVWPSTVSKNWRSFYLRPTWIPNSDPVLVQKLAEVKKEVEIGQLKSPPQLKMESYWQVWRLVFETDKARIASQQLLRDELIKNSSGRHIFDTLVEAIPRWKQEAKLLAETETASLVDRTLAAQKLALLDEALAYWKTAISDYAHWKDEWNFTDAELLDTDKTLPQARFAPAAAPGLKQPFLNAVAELFLAPQGTDGPMRLPRADEYRQHIKRFTELLTAVPVPVTKGKQAIPWVDQMQELALKDATSSTPSAERIAETALLPLIIAELIGFANSYDAAKDQKSPHFVDDRRAHRARMARALVKFGRWMGWNEVLDNESIKDIFANTESAEAETGHEEAAGAALYLVSDWQPDDIRQIADLLTDFPGKADKPIIQGAPFTLRVLVEWFRYDLHRRMGEIMRNLLLAEDRLAADTKLDLEPLNHVRQTRGEIHSVMASSADAEFAIAKPNAFPIKIPHRFVVSDYELVIPPGASVNFFKLIADHEKTQKQIERRAAYVIYPEEPVQGVFGWILPPLDGLYAFLLKIPTIARIVARETGEADAEWYARLAPQASSAGDAAGAADARVSTGLNAADVEELNRVLLKWIQKYGESEEKELPRLWQRLIVLKRRALILRLAPQILHFTEYPYVSHGPSGETPAQAVRRFDTPMRVLQALRSFEGFARPMRERPPDEILDPQAEKDRMQYAVDVQLALLTFGLAPALVDLPRKQTDWELKVALYEFFQLAIDFAEDDKKLKSLKNGLGVQDEVAAIIIPDAGRTALVHKMKNFMTAVEQERKDSQSKHGYRSENGKTILPNFGGSGFSSEIEPSAMPGGKNEWRLHQTIGEDGKLDEKTGDSYRLVKVYVPFEFHPSKGSPPVGGMRKGYGGPHLPATVAIQENGAWVVYTEGNLPHISLFKYAINDKEFEVWADNIDGLNELEQIFLWRSFQISMQNSAIVIETFADWMMTVAGVLFPEVAIAEFVVRMTEMIASGELEDMVGMLKDDPIGFAKKLYDDLGGMFDPSRIWEFVLIGSQHSPLERLRGFWPSTKRKGNPTGKLARFVGALRALGSRFIHAVDRVHEYTQPPFRRAQGRVAMHPTLVWVLKRATHMMAAIWDLIPKDKLQEALASGDGNVLGEFKKIIEGENIEQLLRDRVVELFEGIQHIELPGELVDMTPAIELILGFILSRFGSRGKILKVALQTMPVPTEWSENGKKPSFTNALAFISGLIKEYWLKGSIIDPNKYWKEDVLPLVADKFNEIRDELVNGLYNTVDAALKAMSMAPLKRPSTSELPVATTVPVDLVSESEASLETTGPRPKPAANARLHLPSGGGARLAPPERSRFEHALGADLSHVRVHTNAASATQPIQARAVTSGSHVYVRPGLSTGSAQGQQTLAHELTHVVQQTGAQGLGTPGTRQPGLGRPGLGVRYDRGREAVADKVAARVGQGQPVSPALRSQIGTAQGVQPSIEEEVAVKILTVLSSAEAKDFTKDLEGGKDPPGWQDAKKLADQVFAKIKDHNGLIFAKFMQDKPGGQDISKSVSDQILNPSKSKIDRSGIELKKIAQLAQRPIKKKSEDAPDTELNREGFVQLLANYLFATSHVAMSIGVVGNGQSIRSVELTGLNIAEVGGTSPLWNTVMMTSFPGFSEDERRKAQREMRERLRNLGPQPMIWDGSKYKFAGHIIRDYLDLLKMRETGGLTDVPPVAEYVNTDSAKGDGLAVSTHGKLTTGRSIGTYARESHHTTQYLLIEFFSNHPEASQKAFPGDPDDFKDAGIKFEASGEVDAIEGIGSPISVRHFNPDSNRGANMPAILISARCHQRGELHVMSESRWASSEDVERMGTRTQGYAIENVFNSAIGNADLKPRDSTTVEGRKKLRAAIKANPVAAKTAYYKAALDTYTWMHKRMIPALGAALKTQELAHYRGIAARNHAAANGELESAYNLTAGDIAKVFSSAEKNNDSVMESKKWKAG
jgi:Domain of unknown function (DUF4157)/Novel toxin 14